MRQPKDARRVQGTRVRDTEHLSYLARGANVAEAAKEKIEVQLNMGAYMFTI